MNDLRQMWAAGHVENLLIPLRNSVLATHYVDKYIVCGGLRRHNDRVHDADIVVLMDGGYSYAKLEAVKNAARQLDDLLTQTQTQTTQQNKNDFKMTDDGIRRAVEVKKAVVQANPHTRTEPGQNYQFIKIKLQGVPVDVNFTFNMDQYEVLKLVKTGNAQYNRWMAGRAHKIRPPEDVKMDKPDDGTRMALKFSDGMYGIFAAVPNEVNNHWVVTDPLRNCAKPERGGPMTEKSIIELLEYDNKYREPAGRNWEER